MFSGRIPGNNNNQYPMRGREDVATSSAQRARSSSPDKQRAAEMALTDQLDTFISNFEEMHISTVGSFQKELSEAQTTLSEIKGNLASAQKKNDKLQTILDNRKAGAKERAISREERIQTLETENEELQNYIVNANHYNGIINQTLDDLSGKLSNANQQLDDKSQTINKQAKIISDIKREVTDLKNNFKSDLNDKEGQLAIVKNDNEDLRVTQGLRKINDEYKALMADANTRSKNMMPVKTKLMMETGKRIADQSEVLKKALNDRLITDNKELRSVNKENQAEIARLKAAMEKIMQMTGIEI